MPDQKPDGESWTDLSKTVFFTLLIMLGLRTFVFQAFNIPTSSMEATLLVGDYLFVEKFPYGFSRYSLPFGGWPLGSLMHGRVFGHPPRRGDVVVFKMPNRASVDYMQDFIKRVIGLPGDRIQMIDGVLFINAARVPKTRVGDYDETVDGAVDHVPQYRETLPNGKSYLTLDRGESPLDNTPVYVVPPDHYFMMGDNRDNSDDSRAEVGFVPFENIEGRAALRFFSSDGRAHFWEFWKWPGAIRYKRLFTLID